MLKRTVPGWVLILVVASLAIGAGWTAGRVWVTIAKRTRCRKEGADLFGQVE